MIEPPLTGWGLAVDPGRNDRHQAARTVGQVAMHGSVRPRELPRPPSQVLSQAPLTVSVGGKGALDPNSTDKPLDQSQCTSSFLGFSNQTGQDGQLRNINGVPFENAFEKTRNSIFWRIFSPFSWRPFPSVFLCSFLLYLNVCRSEEIVTLFCSTVSLKEALQQTLATSSSPAWRRAPLLSPCPVSQHSFPWVSISHLVPTLRGATPKVYLISLALSPTHTLNNN